MRCLAEGGSANVAIILTVDFTFCDIPGGDRR